MSLVEDADPPARWVCLDASAVGDVDYSGSETLGAVHEELKRQGVTLVLVHVDDVVRRLLDAYGLTERIGASNLYPTATDAMDAYRALGAPAAGTEGAAG